MNKHLSPSWQQFLAPEFEKDYFRSLERFVDSEYASGEVFPPEECIFNAFNFCELDSVKVVILGQDPYHEPGQAHGLSFSVPEGVKPPPSLVNIYREIAADIGGEPPMSGDLHRWAAQGVLLLNATLTVRAHEAGSHHKHGWERFTDNVIAELSRQKTGLVFMLWGAYAQKKVALINPHKHLILTAVHPSPLSAYRGFFGCRHFSQANSFLCQNGRDEIVW